MEPQITNNKVVKIKDPKRVEQGRRLGLISKEAKRKKSERLADINETQSQSGDGCSSWGVVVGLFSVATAFGLYYKLKGVTETTPETLKTSETSKPKKQKDS